MVRIGLVEPEIQEQFLAKEKIKEKKCDNCDWFWCTYEEEKDRHSCTCMHVPFSILHRFSMKPIETFCCKYWKEKTKTSNSMAIGGVRLANTDKVNKQIGLLHEAVRCIIAAHKDIMEPVFIKSAEIKLDELKNL